MNPPSLAQPRSAMVNRLMGPLSDRLNQPVEALHELSDLFSVPRGRDGCSNGGLQLVRPGIGYAIEL